MGPSRYNHLITFQPKRRILHAARLCCLKKETIGGTLRAKTMLSRLELFTILVVLYRARPFCLYLFPLPASHAPHGTARGSRQESFRVISTARLRTLPPVHLPPINVVVFNDPKGDLILRLASCLDAFSTYPYPTRLPGRAPGGTTGWPEVGPTRSSRTSVSTTQDSCAHDR